MYYSINHDDDLDALYEDGEEVDKLDLKVGKIATGMDEPLKALRLPFTFTPVSGGSQPPPTAVYNTSQISIPHYRFFLFYR